MSELLICSILDHSCSPNCGVTFSGNKITVTAFQNLKNLEEARISYLDHTLPTQTRKEKLFEDYYFHCQCQKCTNTHHRHENRKKNNIYSVLDNDENDCNNNNSVKLNNKRNKGKRWHNISGYYYISIRWEI